MTIKLSSIDKAMEEHCHFLVFKAMDSSCELVIYLIRSFVKDLIHPQMQLQYVRPFRIEMKMRMDSAHRRTDLHRKNFYILRVVLHVSVDCLALPSSGKYCNISVFCCDSFLRCVHKIQNIQYGSKERYIHDYPGAA